MSLIHDPADNCQTIFNEVATNMYDSGLKWFSQQDVIDAMQDAYNKIFCLLSPLEHSTFIPKQSSPYYHLARQISDFMYISAIYNPTTLLWIAGLSYKQFKSEYQTYLVLGEPRYCNVADLRRCILWPYLTNATGVLYLIYKAKAPTITMNHIPVLPYSVGSQILEYFTTATLMEQKREFKKAAAWWDRIYSLDGAEKSIWDQCKDEIKGLARMDRDTVLEPYRWIFHGGDFNTATWINAETPAGTVDGVNVTFTLAQTPNPTTSLLLQKNGQNLTQGTDYTLNGQTITMTTIINPGDIFNAWYQVS